MFRKASPQGINPAIALAEAQAVDNAARKSLFELFLHDVNQKQAILRQATAVGYGLDPGPAGLAYPGSTTVVKGLSGVSVVFLMLAVLLMLLIAAGGAALALGQLKPAAPVVVEAPPAPVPSGHIEWRVEP